MPSALSKRIGEHHAALIRGAVIMLFALLAATGIGASVVGRVLSRLTLDQLLRSNWNNAVPDKNVVLVNITEKDYNDLFHRKRPLDPATIIELIRAAHVAGAKLIAIDISTEDWPEDWDKKLSLPQGAAVVWARNFYLNLEQPGQKYAMQPLLGGVKRASRACYGVPALGEEAGLLRWFYPSFTIGLKQEPSFVAQILYRSQNKSCLQEANGSEAPLIISFSSKIRIESAGTLMEQSKQEGWDRRRPEYADKIVILGGYFHSGADVWETPVGMMSGLEINGQAVSCAMRNDARRELGEFESVSIDIGVGVVLLVCRIFGARIQLIATLLALALSLGLSLCLFRQYHLFLSFLPIAAGILAHRYLERRILVGTS